MVIKVTKSISIIHSGMQKQVYNQTNLEQHTMDLSCIQEPEMHNESRTEKFVIFLNYF
jgi:hypothetical protein